MTFFLLVLLVVLAFTGMGFYAYGTDRRTGRRYKIAGALLFFGGPSAIAGYADWREARNPPPRDPWVCTHTHVETQCRGMRLHTCGPVDVCDEKRLVQKRLALSP